MESMTTQNDGNTQVMEAIKEISSITAEVKNGSFEILRGNTEVGKEIAKLVGISQNIDTTMHSVNSGTEQIQDIIGQVTDNSAKNRQATLNVMKYLEQLTL